MTTTMATRPPPTGRHQLWLEDGDVLRFRGAEARIAGHRVHLRTPEGNRVQVAQTGEGRAACWVELVRTGPEPQFFDPADPPAVEPPTHLAPRGAGWTVFPGELIAGRSELRLGGLTVRCGRGRVELLGRGGNAIAVMAARDGLALAWVTAATPGAAHELIRQTTRPPGDAATPEGPGGRTGGATEPPLCRFGPGGDYARDYTPSPREARP